MAPLRPNRVLSAAMQALQQLRRAAAGPAAAAFEAAAQRERADAPALCAFLAGSLRDLARGAAQRCPSAPGVGPPSARPLSAAEAANLVRTLQFRIAHLRLLGAEAAGAGPGGGGGGGGAGPPGPGCSGPWPT